MSWDNAGKFPAVACQLREVLTHAGIGGDSRNADSGGGGDSWDSGAQVNDAGAGAGGYGDAGAGGGDGGDKACRV